MRTLCLWLLALSVGSASAAELAIRTVAGTGILGKPANAPDATAAPLNNPYGVVIGPDNALYICDMDNHVIRKVADNGAITTVAGTGARGYSGNGGPALAADLNEPYEIRFNRSGEMFFVEMRNHIVRRVDNNGVIHLVAGNGQQGFSGDGGAATNASLSQPHSIQFGPDGALYIADIGNHRIRKVDMGAGVITTFAGTGERKMAAHGAKLEGAPLHGPRAIDFDTQGDMWLALREGNAIFQINMQRRTLHHRAGNGQKGFAGLGAIATNAPLSGPKGISVGPDGRVYFADTESHSIQALDPKTGQLHLIAGTGQKGAGADGPARKCELNRPHGIFADKLGRLFIGDSENHRVRMVAPATGVIP